MTISVTPLPANAPPKNTVSLSVTPGSVMSSVSVWRNGPTGVVLLRSQPSPGFDSRIVDDYECPYGIAVTYGWSANYVAPGTVQFAETWASLAAWTVVGGSWSVSAGKLIWSGLDSVSSTVSRTLTSGQYSAVFASAPTGFSKIDFGGFYIDVNASRLYIGLTSVAFDAGTGAWTLGCTGSQVTITTTAGTYSVTGTGTVAMTQVAYTGAVRTGVYASQFGSAGSGNGQFNAPRGMAFDSSGNIYVVDGNNRRVQKFTSAGVYVSQFGSSGSGNGQFGGAIGIAVDAAGNIYVADGGNNRVQIFTSAGAYSSQFGTAGTGNGQFSNPQGIALDSTGNIYVTDTLNNRVQKFTSTGTYTSQFGTVGTGNGQFTSPRGIAFDSTGNIFVVDGNNNRVQKFSSAGAYTSQFGTAGSGSGQFSLPTGIAIDSSNNIYVVDVVNYRVQKFTAAGVYVSQFGILGSGNGQFNPPSNIAIDAAGNIYVSDLNNRIQKFSVPPTSSGAITVTSYAAPTTITETSSPVTLTPTDAWLVHPSLPSLSYSVQQTDTTAATLKSIGDIANEDNATVHKILGAAKPITTVTGNRYSDQLPIEITTYTAAAEAALYAVLADQTPLLIQFPPAWGAGFQYGFYQVGSVTRAKSAATGGHSVREFTLPLTSVQSPVASVQNTGWSWANVALTYTSWDQIKATYGTFANLAANIKG